MSYTTNAGRNMRGERYVRTVIALGFDRRILEIETNKNGNGGISCDATVFQISEDGRGKPHAFGPGGGGDFRTTPPAARTGRAPEQALLTMHQAGMQGIDAVIAAAKAHYKQAPADEPVPAAKPAWPGLDAMPHQFSTVAGSL